MGYCELCYSEKFSIELNRTKTDKYYCNDCYNEYIEQITPQKQLFLSQFEDLSTRISKEYDSTKENLIIEEGILNKEDKRYLRELEFHLTLTLIRVKEIFEKEGILPNDHHLELTYAPSGV